MAVWRYIDENNVTASYGLAADEYFTDVHTQEMVSPHPAILRLYNYANYSVLAGRFQDINAEIDIERCKELGYGYGRRQTGGGAILMGQGQLGICFTSGSQTFDWQHISELYIRFSEPLIFALKELGIAASFRSKNDLEVNGKKIGGLGVYVNPKGGIQFHTSLLADLEIENMLKVLRIPIQKLSDKRKVKSIEERITTINREVGKELSLNELKLLIKKKYAQVFEIDFEFKQVSTIEQDQINEIAQNRYENEDWIFQRSPQPDMTGVSLKKTPAGLLRTYIGLKGETIKSVLITGDFMDQANLFAEIESRLKWSPLDLKHIEEIVETTIHEFDASGTAPQKLKKKDIISAIWLAVQHALAEKKYTYKGSCYYPKLPLTN